MKNPLYGCTFDFVGKRWYAIVFSWVLIAIGIGAITWHGGLNYAIDFVGGSKIMFSFATPVTQAEEETVRACLAEMGLQGQVQRFQQNGIVIQVKGSEYTDRIHQALVEAKAKAGGKFSSEQQVRDALASFAQMGVADLILRDFAIAADTAALRLDLNAVTDENLKSLIEKMLGEQIASRVQVAVGRKLGLATDTAVAAGTISLNTLNDSAGILQALQGGAAAIVSEALAARQGTYRQWADVDAALAPLGLKSDLVSSAVLLTAPGIDDTIRVDLNTVDRAGLERVAKEAIAQGAPAAELANGAAAIAAVRARYQILPSLEPVLQAPLTPLVKAVVTTRCNVLPFVIDSVEMVGPRVGKDLRGKAMQAIVYCIIAMLVYIGFRFQLKYGVGAVVALIHDVLITLGLFALLGREVDMTVIAALMTLVGFSLNDTVVVFDRIREKLRLTGSRDWAGTINAAINETLSRTIITSLTVLITTIALLLFGSAVTFDFALVMTVGVFIGTYSSIFVAAPILIEWHNYFERVR